jgi:hypothetical protein
MAEENKRCKEAARHFECVRRYAVNGLPNPIPHDRDRVRELIAWLETPLGELRREVFSPAQLSPYIAQCYARQRGLHLACLTQAALTVYYEGGTDCIKSFCRTLFGSAKHWPSIRGEKLPYKIEKLPVFTCALIDSLLQQTKGWREASEPVNYIVRQTHNMALRQS